MSGTADVVVAGGVQNMSAIPISAAMIAGRAVRLPRPVLRVSGLAQALRRRAGVAVPLRRDDRRASGAVTRRDMEEFALRSHQRAIAAIDAGPLRPRDRRRSATSRRTTCPRRDTTLEKMAALPAAALEPDGRITAAVSSQICDGSAALLVMSERAVRDHGLTPRARDPPPLRARRGPGLDAHRADPGHRARAGQGGPDDRRHRPRRDQRGVRLGRARLAGRRPAPTRSGSTSTAARSRSATRSAPPAPG